MCMLLDLLWVKGNILVLGLMSVQVVHSVWKVENLVQQPVWWGPWVAGGVLQIDLGWVVMGKIGLV